jgi:hypothetical protein
MGLKYIIIFVLCFASPVYASQVRIDRKRPAPIKVEPKQLTNQDELEQIKADIAEIMLELKDIKKKLKDR